MSEKVAIISDSFSASMLRLLSRFEGCGCGDVAEWPSGKLSAGDGLPLRTMALERKLLEVLQWCARGRGLRQVLQAGAGLGANASVRKASDKRRPQTRIERMCELPALGFCVATVLRTCDTVRCDVQLVCKSD